MGIDSKLGYVCMYADHTLVNKSVLVIYRDLQQTLRSLVDEMIWRCDIYYFDLRSSADVALTHWRCFDSSTICTHLLTRWRDVDYLDLRSSADETIWRWLLRRVIISRWCQIVTQCHYLDTLVSDRSLCIMIRQFALRWAITSRLINECLIIAPFLNDSVIYAQQ